MIFTKNQIFKQLKDMHAPQNSVVLIHSSLRQIGEVEGRGEGLLNAFIEYFTESGGLLCIPTHTWANIGDESKITLDFTNPSTCIGTLPNIAARDMRAVRSLHPTHSMVVFGEKSRAIQFVSGEDKQVTPAHPSGCYGKIYDLDGYILLVGVGHNRNTYLHCVEEMLGVSNRLSLVSKRATVRHKDGHIEEKTMYPHEAVGLGDISLKYPKYEDAFRYHGAITDGYIGNAEAQLCNARKMKNAMELIYQRSGGIELLGGDSKIKKEFYQ